jgi:hypothetical protein
MINIFSLDPWKLDRIDIRSKHLLPSAGGLYFVFQQDKLLYVGKTESGFNTRWHYRGGHHREYQLLQMEEITIACWVRSETGKELHELEKQANQIFKPLLNGTPVTKGIVTTGAGRRKSKRNHVDVPVSNLLHQRLQKFAVKTGLSVEELCSKAIRRGLPVLIQEESDQLKREQMFNQSPLPPYADSVPKERLDEAIALLRGMTE